MMKKVLLVVLTLAIATSLSFAQTSGPSNVAGYVKITCGGTTYLSPFATPFGLPFKFWNVTSGVPEYGVESAYPSDIVGDQANPGGPVDSDKIVKQGGHQAYRDAGASNAWVDLLEDNGEMVPGDAYWYVNKTGASRDLVLAGEVDNAGSYGTKTIAAPTTGTNYANPYSWRDSRNVSVDNLGLLEQGFTGAPLAVNSDKVVQQGGSGLQLNYITGTGWDYGFTSLDPGLAYWIVNKHAGHPWDYTYVGIPTLLSPNGNEGVVTSTSKTPTVNTKAQVRATTSKENSKTSKSNKNTVDSK